MVWDSLTYDVPSTFVDGARQTQLEVIELVPGSILEFVGVVMVTEGAVAYVQVTFTSGGNKLVFDLQPQTDNYNNWISRAGTALSHDWQWYGHIQVPLAGQSYLSYQSVINRTGADINIRMQAHGRFEVPPT